VIERVARKRGFEPLATRHSYGGGGDGRHETTRGIFPSVRFGGLAYDDALATTAGGEADPLGRYHGYLGLGAFSGYRVTVDLKEGKLVLARGGGRAGSGSPYWDVDGQLLVEAREKKSGESGAFLLDTGATRTIVSRSFADLVPGAILGAPADVRGFGGRIEGVRSLSGVDIAWSGLVAGGELRASDLSRRSRLAGVEVRGFLGLDALAGAILTVDTASHTIEARKP
jgi:hypothetical protein